MIQVTPEKLLAKIGALVIENDVLRQQLAQLQQEQPAEQPE